MSTQEHSTLMKICTKCGETKPATPEYFNRNTKASSGIISRCKHCTQISSRIYHQMHRTEQNAKNRAYRDAHRIEHRIRNRAYRQTHYEHCKARDRAYRQAHYEEEKIRRRARYATNREEAKAKSRAWRQANPERMRKTIRAWSVKYPEKVLGYGQRYRALKQKASICDFTPTQWISMQEHYDHRCVYCGKRRKGKLTQDHIQPLSKGGNHTASNIVPACRSCNSRKNNGQVPKPIQPILLMVP